MVADALNRIATGAASTYAQSSTHCWGESFTIDGYGNLTGIGNLSSAYNGCTNTENFSVAVSSSTNRITTSGYCYDSAGNLLGLSNCTTYEYNAENQLVATAGVTYTYDGDGKRVKKDQTSGSTYDRLYWYGLGLDVLAESDLSGNLTEEYVFFAGLRVARRNVSSGNIYYYVADHLGTSRTIVQAGQTSPCYDADFYPYGGERVVTNTCPQNYKFTGKEREGESNLDYFMARHYPSWMGRFLQPDEPFADQYVADPQSWNLYTYVRNNPLNFVDPTGREWACTSVTVTTLEPDQEERYKIRRTTKEECVWYPDMNDAVDRMQTAALQHWQQRQAKIEEGQRGFTDREKLQALKDSVKYLPEICSVGVRIRAGLGERATGGIDLNSGKGLRFTANARIFRFGPAQGSVGFNDPTNSSTNVGIRIPQTPVVVGVSSADGGNTVSAVTAQVEVNKYTNVGAYADVANSNQCGR